MQWQDFCWKQNSASRPRLTTTVSAQPRLPLWQLHGERSEPSMANVPLGMFPPHRRTQDQADSGCGCTWAVLRCGTSPELRISAAHTAAPG